MDEQPTVDEIIAKAKEVQLQIEQREKKPFDKPERKRVTVLKTLVDGFEENIIPGQSVWKRLHCEVMENEYPDGKKSEPYVKIQFLKEKPDGTRTKTPDIYFVPCKILLEISKRLGDTEWGTQE